jgi:hypothetical protein
MTNMYTRFPWPDLRIEVAKNVTPPGLERGPNVTGTHLVTQASTERTAGEWPAATAGCNECNEAVETARDALTVARRLAMVAYNAIANGDLTRARAALLQLHDAVASAPAPKPEADAPTKETRRP